eukprot:g4921.t1
MAGQLLEANFSKLLSTLDLRTESIKRVSKYAMQHGGVWAVNMLRLVLEEMRRVDVKSRVKLLYLIDSICQRDKARADTIVGERMRFIPLVLELLPAVLRLVLPPSVASRYPKNALALQKVASVWASRRIFPPAALLSVKNAALFGAVASRLTTQLGDERNGVAAANAIVGFAGSPRNSSNKAVKKSLRDEPMLPNKSKRKGGSSPLASATGFTASRFSMERLQKRPRMSTQLESNVVRKISTTDVLAAAANALSNTSDGKSSGTKSSESRRGEISLKNLSTSEILLAARKKLSKLSEIENNMNAAAAARRDDRTIVGGPPQTPSHTLNAAAGLLQNYVSNLPTLPEKTSKQRSRHNDIENENEYNEDMNMDDDGTWDVDMNIDMGEFDEMWNDRPNKGMSLDVLEADYLQRDGSRSRNSATSSTNGGRGYQNSRSRSNSGQGSSLVSTSGGGYDNNSGRSSDGRSSANVSPPLLARSTSYGLDAEPKKENNSNTEGTMMLDENCLTKPRRDGRNSGGTTPSILSMPATPVTPMQMMHVTTPSFVHRFDKKNMGLENGSKLTVKQKTTSTDVQVGTILPSPNVPSAPPSTPNLSTQNSSSSSSSRKNRRKAFSQNGKSPLFGSAQMPPPPSPMIGLGASPRYPPRSPFMAYQSGALSSLYLNRQNYHGRVPPSPVYVQPPPPTPVHPSSHGTMYPPPSPNFFPPPSPMANYQLPPNTPAHHQFAPPSPYIYQMPPNTPQRFPPASPNNNVGGGSMNYDPRNFQQGGNGKKSPIFHTNTARRFNRSRSGSADFGR